jgi:hypothetical protein
MSTPPRIWITSRRERNCLPASSTTRRCTPINQDTAEGVAVSGHHASAALNLE